MYDICKLLHFIVVVYSPCGGTRWRSRLGHRATSRKDMGSIPDEVIGFCS
jgi:hypothetical protein